MSTEVALPVAPLQDVEMRPADNGATPGGVAAPVLNDENGQLTPHHSSSPAAIARESGIDAAMLLNSPPVENLPEELSSLELQREALRKQAAAFEQQASSTPAHILFC